MTGPVSLPSCGVSWLSLERYHLGELEGAAAEAVARSLEACPHCQAMEAEIAGDLRPLPALPPLPAAAPLPEPAAPEPVRGLWQRLSWALVEWKLVHLAVLAVGLFVVVQLPRLQERTEEHPGWPPAEVSVKGGTLAVEVLPEPAGERLQIRVTCPPGAAELELVFFEGREAAFPLALPACGNGVVAGAVRLEEVGPSRVCLVQGVRREALREHGASALGLADAACARLDP